jgi:hypothetical protein
MEAQPQLVDDDKDVEDDEEASPPEPFFLLARNKDFVDGRRKYPCFGPGTVPAALVVSVLALGLFVLPLVFLLREVSSLSEMSALRSTGVRTEAVVVELHQEGRSPGRVCSVSYNYTLPDQPKGPRIDGHDRVAAEFCTWFEDHAQQLCSPAGPHPCDRGSIMVIHDPAGAGHSRIDFDRSRLALWISGAAAAVTGALLLLLAGALLRIWRRNCRLGAEGKRLAGEVVSARVARSKANKLDLHYVFLTPDGRELEGEIEEFWDQPPGTPPPFPSTPLVVLYVDDGFHKVL